MNENLYTLLSKKNDPKAICIQTDFKPTFEQVWAKSVRNRFRAFCLRSHDAQIDWNRFQIDLKVTCEQGVCLAAIQN